MFDELKIEIFTDADLYRLIGRAAGRNLRLIKIDMMKVTPKTMRMLENRDVLQ